MRGYELTGRGKFLIAVLLVVVLLIILALSPISWGSLRNTTPDNSLNNPGGIPQNDTNPIPADSEQDPEADSEETQASQNGSHSDSAVIDIDAGVMTFLYTPATQKALNDSTLSMIGELVKSPKYTDDSVIAIEIPHLPDEDDAVTLTTAIIEAFTSLEVPLSDVVFFVYQTESDAGSFEIKISLIRQE